MCSFLLHRLSLHVWQLHGTCLCLVPDILDYYGDFMETFIYVFEALFLASMEVFALRQFAVVQFLREVVIFHADNMTGPTKLWLHQDGVDAGKRS